MTETGIIEADGGRLEYDVAGAGRAVVLLHPGLWDRRTWDGHFERFARLFRVMRFDARGYGRSSRLEPGRPYSPLEDLGSVMDAVGMSSATLVGCSMGGATAVDFALTHPERVEALVLVAPGMNGYEETTPAEEEELARLWEPIERALEAGDLERARDEQLRMWAPLGTDDEAGRRIREIAFDNLHELTMDESAAQELSPPAIERLEEITVPTLVLPADHDPIAHRRVSRLYADGIPGARLVQIAETDHVLNLRRPVEFEREVLAFLADLT